MPASDPGRPQDQGRPHRRRSAPSPATRTLLERWHATLRVELGLIVGALEATTSGLIGTDLVIPLHDARRDRLIARGVTVGRELGAEVDETPATSEDRARRRRPAPVKFE